MFSNTPTPSSCPESRKRFARLPRDLLVVLPDPVDRKPVAKVLGAAFDQPHEGHGAERVEGRQHREREDVEHVAEVGDLADEAEGDEGARDREDVDRRARGALAHGLRPGPLESEVLGAERGQELLRIGLRHRHLDTDRPG
jgi:hypothetical protein